MLATFSTRFYFPKCTWQDAVCGARKCPHEGVAPSASKKGSLVRPWMSFGVEAALSKGCLHLEVTPICDLWVAATNLLRQAHRFQAVRPHPFRGHVKMGVSCPHNCSDLLLYSSGTTITFLRFERRSGFTVSLHDTSSLHNCFCMQALPHVMSSFLCPF